MTPISRTPVARSSLGRQFMMAVIGVCVCLARFCPAQDTPPRDDLARVVLQLPWSHRMQFAGYYLAQAKGYYREAGLDVEIRERQGETSPVESVVLDAAGIPPDSVQGAPLPPRWDPGTGGRPDPVFCHRGGLPITLQQRGIPYVLFHPRNYGADTYGEILFTARRVAREHPKQVLAFREASLRGWAYALVNLDEAVDLVHALYAPGIARETLEDEARFTQALVAEDTVPLGFISPERWRQGLQTMARVRKLPYDAERARDSLFDLYLAARARRNLRWIRVALLGTVAAVLLLGGLILWLLRVVKHRTNEIARSRLEIARENEALKQAEARLLHQHGLAMALTRATTLQACLDEATASCLQISGVDCCGILSADFQRQELKALACKGVADTAAAQFTVRALDSPQGTSLARGEPCQMNEAAIRRLFPGLHRDGVRALLVYPMLFNAGVTALLCLGSHQKNAATEAWLVRAAPMAVMLGSTLHRMLMIQELAANERALRESERLFRIVTEGAFDGIALLDDAGKIRYANGFFATLTGYAVDELVGMHYARLTCPEDRAELADHLRRRQRSDDARNEHETRLLRRDGELLSIMLSSRQVFWEGRAAFAVVARDIAERKRLEAEMLRISEWERIRIGQELHDSIGQQLAGMAYLIGVLARKLEHERSAHVREAREIAQIASTTHEQLREVTRSLLPLQEQDGLLAGLQRLCVFTRERRGVDCEVRVEGKGTEAIGSIAANHLICLAQEAIANAIRHGNARHVAIFLKLSGWQARIEIADDGCGFDVGGTRADGSGLRIMRYRADMLGGVFAIQRNADGGMRVSCTFNPAAAGVTRVQGPGSDQSGKEADVE
jgi:PAS domain S-box-containing protein